MGKVISVAMTFKDAFSNPCKNTIRNLKTMGREAQMTGRTITKAGTSIARAGSALTKRVTLPIVAIGAASVKTAADFEASMSNVKAITGASGKDFTDLTEHAKKLGATTAWSAKEVSQAMQYTGMAGWTAKENIEGLKGILDLASASGSELGKTSDIVTDAISAFGYQAKDSAQFADVMTKACTSANVSVDTLGESYKYAAAVCGTMKYSVEDATTALAVMGNNGIKGSTAGNTLKNAITNLAAPTKQMKGAMKELGISITNSDGSMKSLDQIIQNIQGSFKGLTKDQQAAYAKAIFGKQAMAGMLSIIKTSPQDYNKLSKAIKNSGGAADDAAKTQLDNLKGQLTLLKSAAEGAAITIGNKLAPFLKKLTSKIQGVTDWFNKLNDKQVDFIIKIAGIVAAVGPALLIVGKLTRTVGRVIMIFGTLTRAIGAAGGIMGLIASPAGIVIAVIAALAIVAVLVIKNWSKVKPVFMKLVTFLKTTFGPIFKQIGSLIKQAVMPVIKALGKVFKSLMPIIKSVFQTAIKAVIPIIKALMDTFKKCAPIIKQIFAAAIKALNPIIKTLGKVIKTVAPIISKILGTAIKALGPVIKAISKVIQKVFVPIFKKVLPVIFKFVAIQFKVVGTVFKFVAGIISKVVSGIASFISNAFNVIKKVISSVMNFIVPPVKRAFNTIKSIIKGVGSTIGKIINGIKNVFSGIIQFVKGVFTGNWKKAWGGIKKIFSSIWETLGNVCKKPLNFIIGLINKCIGAINKLSIKVPKWVPGVGGKKLGFKIPKIPQLAKGTDNWMGGLVQVHERGGEIIDLPKGSRVYPHDESVRKARQEGNKTTNININKVAEKVVINNDDDIDAFADKFANRLKVVFDNM